MARPGAKRGASDDPVVDWGPDAGQGLFDPQDVTASGDPTGHAAGAAEVTGERAGRDVTASPPRERPMAVLAWIGATLSANPGRRAGSASQPPGFGRPPGAGPPGLALRQVPALAALLADEPLELLPGGFFPIRSPELPPFEQDNPVTDSPAPAGSPTPAEPAPHAPRLQIRPTRPEPSGWAPRLSAILLGLGLACLLVERGCG